MFPFIHLLDVDAVFTACIFNLFFPRISVEFELIIFFVAERPLVGQGHLIIEASWSQTHHTG